MIAKFGARLVAATAAVALLVVACGGTTTSSAPSGASSQGSPGTSAETVPSSVTAGDGRITIASRETVDAAWATETDDAVLLTLAGVAEPLTRSGFDGLLEPSLATEWERSDDLTWEFTLREGVTFHDGTPLDGAAVVAALTHVLDAEAPARSFNKSTFESVTSDSPTKVQIKTLAPNALVPFYMASFNTVILAPKAYTGSGIDPTMAGTGPFKISAIDLPQGFTLDRNDDYWGGPVGLAGVDFRLIPDGETRATLIQTGEADLASTIPIPSVPLLEGASEIAVLRGDLARTNTLYFNNTRAPLDDIRVRQALQSAIDVDAIANQVLEGAVTPAVGPFAATAPWAPDDAAPIIADQAKAKKLLAEAGVTEGSLSIGLWTYPSRAELPDVAVAIQGMLADVGVNAEVRVADYAALEPDFLAGNFDMIIVSRSYLTDINDPASYMRSDYTCEGSFNITNYCDPALDVQLETVLNEEDPEARYAVYEAAAEKLQADAVATFLYNPQEIAAHSTKLQNLRIHPLEHYLLTPQLTLSD